MFSLRSLSTLFASLIIVEIQPKDFALVVSPGVGATAFRSAIFEAAFIFFHTGRKENTEGAPGLKGMQGTCNTQVCIIWIMSVLNWLPN